MPRIYKKKVDIDYAATRSFFAKRASRAEDRGAIGATSYQDENPGLAIERDQHEKKIIQPYLDLHPGMKVLEIGCGTGRWAEVFQEQRLTYLGLDYSRELIDVVKKRFSSPDATMRFQVMSAADLDEDEFLVPPPFDLILLAGLFIYLNDKDFDYLMGKLPALAGNHSRLYIRDPVSIIENRLTLQEFYSEELGTEYNAIYRTDAEYIRAFELRLFRAGFVLERFDFLFPERLCNRTETRQKYYILARG